jgi:hypothetical protein
MEKIVLKDKTEILVEGGTTTNAFTTVVQGTEGVKALLDKLTEENLSSMEMQNEAGLVCAVWENRILNNVNVVKIEKTENYKAVVTLVEKDAVLLRLEALEAGQALQDNAIADMSETVYA